MPPFRLAVLGAGPIGLEAALRAQREGIHAELFEQGGLADSVSRWGFVRFFSPFSLNHSDLGRACLEAAGVSLPAPDSFLSGTEFIERYLRPLSELPELRDSIHLQHKVCSISRTHLGKNGPIGPERESHPLRLLLDTPDGEQARFFDAVWDCTGCYRQPLFAGDGGAPALGERELHDQLLFGLHPIQTLLDQHPTQRRFAVIGAGMSAATSLDSLVDHDDVSVDWITRSEKNRPYIRRENDPLPERDRLAALGNALAAGMNPAVRRHRGQTLLKIARPSNAPDGPFLLHLSGGGPALEVDHVLVHTGFTPDRSLYEELQFHECYASLGPMKLAATLLSDAGGDCLAQTGSGVETLMNPEPNFFVLGSKSYGRNSQFLIRLGLEQIDELIPELHRAVAASAVRAANKDKEMAP